MDYNLALIAVMSLALVLYIVLGGADFGAGIWEFNSLFRSSEKERDLIFKAMGPVWEVNHVWLIFILVCLFAAFPMVFAAICRALWIPLLLALAGIVFRGAGFAFRTYSVGMKRQPAVWQALFGLASTATPFFFGASFGALISHRLPIDATGQYSGNYFTDWISGFSIFSAFFFIGICLYISAVFLAREASHGNDEGVTHVWRERAITMGTWLGVLSVVGLGLLFTEAHDLWAAFVTRSWPIVGIACVCGIASLTALIKRWFGWATILAPATIACVVIGWLVAQYPWIIPPYMSVENAIAPVAVIQNMVWAVVAGMVILIPSLYYLFHLFKITPKHPLEL